MTISQFMELRQHEKLMLILSKINLGQFSNFKYIKGYMTMSDIYLSEYEERINRTPSEPSRWIGKRGESECKAITQITQSILDEYGQKGVYYSDGIPDFSPFSESTVSIDKMSRSRTSTKTKILDKNNAFGRAESYCYQTKMGNYDQADIETAKEWTSSKRENLCWSPHDVKVYRKQNGLTWHECNDRKTMMLIPTNINREFTHLGGTSETRKKSDFENLATQSILYTVEKEIENNAFQRALKNSNTNTKISLILKEHSK